MRKLLIFYIVLQFVSLTHAQIKPLEKNYYAISFPGNTNSPFNVFGVFTDTIQKINGITRISMPYVPSNKWSIFPPDTLTHPLGRTIIISESFEIYVITRFYDTLIIPSFFKNEDIVYSFQKSKNYRLKKASVLAVSIPETGIDSVAYWDLYLDSANFQYLICSQWIGIGKTTGLQLFHDVNRPDSIGNFYFKIPYRKTDIKRILNYQPGDWLEYRENCNFQFDLGGPSDYVRMEVLTRYNDSEYKVKETTINITAQNMKLYYDSTIKYIDKSNVFCAYDLKLNRIPTGDFAAGNLYNLSTPNDILYDTLKKEFVYTNRYYTGTNFEPRFDGCYAQENIGITSIYRSNFATMTNECAYLHAAHIAGVTDFGSRFNSIKYHVSNSRKLFPNPVIDELIIEDEQWHSISVFDIYGNCIIKEIFLQNNRANLSSLPTGIYLIRSSENPYLFEKIMKQ